MFKSDRLIHVPCRFCGNRLDIDIQTIRGRQVTCRMCGTKNTYIAKSEEILSLALNKEGIPHKSQVFIRTERRRYLVDKLVPPNIIIEQRGNSHFGREQRDLQKTLDLENAGYVVHWVPDRQVYSNVEAVVQIIKALKTRIIDSQHGKQR